MFSKLRKQTEGFTIIEVLIVLAIAGLIMLIVFLAVPALQRNARNNARNAEVSRIAGLVTECLANRNGLTPSCDTAGEVSYNTDDFQQLTTLNISTTGTAPGAGVTSAGVWFNRVCLANGSGVDTAATAPSSRAFIVLFSLEPSVTRCLSS